MSQLAKLMFVKFLISAASWTRILKDLTHHLEWSLRFELTGQEWWPKAKQQGLSGLSTPESPAHRSQRQEPQQDTFPAETHCTPQQREMSLKSSKLLQVCTFLFCFVLLN